MRLEGRLRRLEKLIAEAEEAARWPTLEEFRQWSYEERIRFLMNAPSMPRSQQRDESSMSVEEFRKLPMEQRLKILQPPPDWHP